MFAFINSVRTNLQRFVYINCDLSKCQLQECRFMNKADIYTTRFLHSYYPTPEKLKSFDSCKIGDKKAPTRWGIVSAGKISHDFVTELTTLPNQEHRVVAIAARELDRAQKFAELHKIPKACGSYEELAQDKNIDVVYIGAINSQHLQIGNLMLKCGKTVLCEKTLGLNLKQSRELLDIARENKILLMEAIWTRCFPVYEILRKELDSGKVGDIVQVYATAGCSNAVVEKIKSKELEEGSIRDLDCYPLQFASFVFESQSPKDTAALGHINENGVDLSMGCVITYENGQTAILSTHTRAEFPNDAVIIGTKGSSSILVPYTITSEKNYKFHLPNAASPPNCKN